MVHRLLYRLIQSLALLILSYFLCAFLLSVLATSIKSDDCKKDKTIFVKSNGFHAEIVIPVAYLREHFVDKLHMPFTAHYLSFGWGDKNFYLNTPTLSDVTFNTAFEALFMKSETVLHVSAYRKEPWKLRKDWTQLQICQHQLDKVINHVYKSFKDENIFGFVTATDKSYGNADNFFDANGSYSCLYTCNTWVIDAFHKADLPVAIWSPFEFGILYHLSE